MSDWRFEVEDVGEDSEPEIEPGQPRLEHVAFVLVGVVAALLVVASLLI